MDIFRKSRNLYISHVSRNCIFIAVCEMCNHLGKSILGVQPRIKQIKITLI